MGGAQAWQWAERILKGLSPTVVTCLFINFSIAEQSRGHRGTRKGEDCLFRIMTRAHHS